MPFSKEGKALTTNLCQFKKYGSWKTETECSVINCKGEELDTYLKKNSGNEALTIGARAADQSTRVLKRKRPL